MTLEWDDAKRRINLAKHGLDFADVVGFEWASALTAQSAGQDYGEERWAAIGRFGKSICVVVYTMRGQTVRVMSFRKASKMERQLYGR